MLKTLTDFLLNLFLFATAKLHLSLYTHTASSNPYGFSLTVLNIFSYPLKIPRAVKIVIFTAHIISACSSVDRAPASDAGLSLVRLQSSAP